MKDAAGLAGEIPRSQIETSPIGAGDGDDIFTERAGYIHQSINIDV
jgi:hypothetical protein